MCAQSSTEAAAFKPCAQRVEDVSAALAQKFQHNLASHHVSTCPCCTSAGQQPCSATHLIALAAQLCLRLDQALAFDVRLQRTRGLVPFAFLFRLFYSDLTWSLRLARTFQGAAAALLAAPGFVAPGAARHGQAQPCQGSASNTFKNGCEALRSGEGFQLTGRLLSKFVLER